jgi:hypothetical protein
MGNQAPVAGVMDNGLTPLENAILDDEEKLIRLRERGLA